MEAEHPNWLDAIQWDERGLVAAIAQDVKTHKVLMLAWMSRESLQATLDTQVATYWSRSRQKLWRKGESSGHTQKLRSIHLDCDGDALLLMVEQVGGIACHTGRQSCFYQQLTAAPAGHQWQATEPVIKSPDEIYS